MAQMALADVPLARFLEEALVPYETDEITRLIMDSHDAQAFAPVRHLTVGDFRNWLLGRRRRQRRAGPPGPGLTPEMVAAVSKIMRHQDLILVASRCRVTSGFRNTLGLPGRLATRLQPNHPTDRRGRHCRQHH
jgi:ethanolamine ammonia-lyase large subunit